LGNDGALLEVTRDIIRTRSSPLPVGEPFTLDAMCRATLEIYQELDASPRS